jgi:hypothetical protein
MVRGYRSVSFHSVSFRVHQWRGRILILEYKLRRSRAQAMAIEEAIRTTQSIHNNALRLWMDRRGMGANALQVLCSRLAKEHPFAASTTRKRARRRPQEPGRRLSASTPTAASSDRGRKAIPAASMIVARWSRSRSDGSWAQRASASRSPMAAGVAGIYAVATIERARRRGMGTAVTLPPLLDARARGYVAGVLRFSEMGYGIYAGMGFTQQFRYHSSLFQPD